MNLLVYHLISNDPKVAHPSFESTDELSRRLPNDWSACRVTDPLSERTALSLIGSPNLRQTTSHVDRVPLCLQMVAQLFIHYPSIVVVRL
jgi:hypothetical protein